MNTIEINKIKNALNNNNEYLSDKLLYEFKNSINKEKYNNLPKNYKGVLYFYQPYSCDKAKNIIDFTINLFKKKTNKEAKTFLDVGCGAGNICFIADKLNLESSGIELCDELLEFGKQLVPNCNFIKEDIYKYQNYNDFDIIWVFNPTMNNDEIDSFIGQLKKPTIIIPLNSKYSKHSIKKYGFHTETHSIDYRHFSNSETFILNF